MLRSFLVAAICCAVASQASAHRVYLAPDNHTDYGWNFTVAQYETAMLAELDYYLGRIAATAAKPAAEQARYSADCWYWLWLYEKNRTPQQFQALIDAMRTGHITVPLNPFVTLYGALPTEAAIRGGNYPGRIERRFGVPFPLGQDIEIHTSPWGLATLWWGSGVRYTWKGVCGCATVTPFDQQTTELFRWHGPDDHDLLFKWYQLTANSSYGGYAEARDNLSSSAVQNAINYFSSRPPNAPITGLFGAGWDDLSYTSTAFENLATQWNAAHPGGDQVVVSNTVDYFKDLEALVNAGTVTLPVLRGGWGNDWDLWPTTLTERTAQTRRAVERLRAAEALSAVAQSHDAAFWGPRQTALELAWVDYFKYFEHTWVVAGGVPLSSMENNKKAWAQSFTGAVTAATQAAATRVAALFATPNEDRFAAFNPLVFDRDDHVDLPVSSAGPYVVTDVATGQEVAAQVVRVGTQNVLRVLASSVPSLGYRVYRYAPGTPAARPDVATISGSVIESARWRVTLGNRGQIVGLYDKASSRELVQGAMNDFGSGTSAAPVAENAGPISATLRADITGTPNRRVRVTLEAGSDRVAVENEVLANASALASWRYALNLTAPQIRFEEVGAVARPGLASQGGDFLPGTRADWMTLNHFVAFSTSAYTVTLSSADLYAMKFGSSTTTAFDLSTPTVNVLALGAPAGGDITNQGGDSYFLQRFAIYGSASPWSGPQAMRDALSHQNPLEALPLGRGQAGPLTAPASGFLSVSAPNVVVTAFKPAEEPSRGFVVRAWEMGGAAASFDIVAPGFSPGAAWQVSLIETDIAPATVSAGRIAASIGPHEIKAWRFTAGPGPGSDGGVSDGGGTADGGAAPDAGPGADAGPRADAGGTDAGAGDDAGPSQDDAGSGLPDAARVPTDASSPTGDGGAPGVVGACGCGSANAAPCVAALFMLLASVGIRKRKDRHG